MSLNSYQKIWDDLGGTMNIFQVSDNETNESQTGVRIDTAGIILNRMLPKELDLATFLTITVPARGITEPALR